MKIKKKIIVFNRNKFRNFLFLKEKCHTKNIQPIPATLLRLELPHLIANDSLKKKSILMHQLSLKNSCKYHPLSSHFVLEPSPSIH